MHKLRTVFVISQKGNRETGTLNIFNLEKAKIEQHKKSIVRKKTNNLNNNIAIHAKYKNNLIEAILDTNDYSVKYNGKHYKSVSGAAIAAKIQCGANLKNTENGWKFWRFLKNEKMIPISELRK